MTLTADLYRLEGLDGELERQEADLARVRRSETQNPELRAAQTHLEGVRAQKREAEAEQRTLEAELADLQTRVERGQRRMYGGQIVDPRDLASLQKELDHWTSLQGPLEDRLLLAMERVEALQAALARDSLRVQELQERWEGEKPILARRAEELAQGITALRAERDSLAHSIDPTALSLYGRLRSSAGHAVSRASEGVCQWCRVTLPPKDVQHARAGALVTCTNCSRILYAG